MNNRMSHTSMFYMKKFEQKDAYLLDFLDKAELLQILEAEPCYFDIVFATESYTVFRENEPVLIVFWFDDIFKNRELGMFAGKNLDKYFCKSLFVLMKDILELAKIGKKRVQAKCTKNLKYSRFLEALGFEKEATLLAYGFGGTDMNSYVLR